MICGSIAAVALVLAARGGVASAQSPAAPIPLYPGTPPSSIAPQPLPPVAPEAPPAPPNAPAALAPAPPDAAPAERVFCEQPVRVQLADPAAVPQPYRRFVGMFSDASWTPQLCAALIVENVTADGSAMIVYAFGPMGSSERVPGGVLHGTGIVKDGELRFQNSDGSQFAFRPLYGDLDGHLTTPQGQQYEAVFKRQP